MELADNARIKRSMKPKTGKPRVRIYFNGCALITDNSGSKFWLYEGWLRWVNEQGWINTRWEAAALKPIASEASFKKLYMCDWVAND